MTNVIATVATGAIAVYGVLHLFLHYTQDAREPPLVTTLFPFIGTLVGLSRKKNKYYTETRYIPLFSNLSKNRGVKY